MLVRHYWCLDHPVDSGKQDKRRWSVLDEHCLEVMYKDLHVKLSTPILITGKVAFSLSLAEHLWCRTLDTGWDGGMAAV